MRDNQEESIGLRVASQLPEASSFSISNCCLGACQIELRRAGSDASSSGRCLEVPSAPGIQPSGRQEDFFRNDVRIESLHRI
jgi:hypothetical protein